MSSKLTILLVEDSPRDAEFIESELQAARMDYAIMRVDNRVDFAQALIANCPRMILSDFSIPGFGGIEALEIARQKCKDVPFIVVSGAIGEETAVDMLKRGATDYVLKSRISRLVPAVQRALAEASERETRIRLERQCIEAQKMEVVGHLAGGVAHDFNNILGVIIRYSDLIRMELAEKSPLRDNLDQIRHAAERAASLTQQLLVFSRKQEVQLNVLDLNEVLGNMQKMLERLIDENIHLTVECDKRIGRIKADPGYINQIVMNMVVNARDAMPRGGCIRITTRHIVLGDDYVRTHAGVNPGPYVVLTICDTGMGMDNATKQRLFEAFFTTKPEGKGTGLGLATCRTIVKQCGGHIDVQSEPGQGTTFSVYFPCVNQPLTAPGRVSPSGPAPTGTETVLLVEDEPSVRRLASDYLKSLGYRVFPASNGQEGLQVARQCGDRPMSLVITDIVMPQMGGKDMAEWLRSSHPNLKILFTSGYSDQITSGLGVSGPGIAFLPKPYTPLSMARKVRELLDAPIGNDRN